MIVGRREGHLVQNSELLLTIAEIAVAFTGFASLISVLASKSTTEHPLLQSVRFQGMVNMSLIAVAFSLVPFVPLHLGLSPALSWRISSALFLLVGLASTINGARQAAIARATVGAIKGGTVRVTIIFGGVTVALVLLGANTLGFTAATAFGLYATALLLFLFGSGVAFMALLFAHIHPVTRELPAANKALNRTWNSAVRMTSYRPGINHFRLGGGRWRYSTPVNADPLGGARARASAHREWLEATEC
jgi:hypothetical protein